jgi:hypothetical protein
MRMKAPPTTTTTVIRFANLPSLVFPGKSKVGYFLDRPRIWPLLSNGSVNKFAWQPNHVTTTTDMNTTAEALL